LLPMVGLVVVVILVVGIWQLVRADSCGKPKAVAVAPEAAAPRACPPESFMICTERCNEGDGTSCDNLGEIYAKGLAGNAPDHAMALKAFERSCEIGAPSGCMNLGHAHVAGKGVTRDEAKARVAYARARALYLSSCTDAHHAIGCGAYGSLLVQGLGGPQDVATGVDYLQRACTGGDLWSCKQLDKLDGG
jgi:TPR repeat protein